MDTSILLELVVISGLSIAVIFFCHKIRIPAIVGFLITGVVAGPNGLGLVGATHEVEIMAEIGIILLLFTIGLEMSIGHLMKLKKPVFIGGFLQVALTVISAWLISALSGAETGASIFFGFLASLSSTAIVLKLFQERAEVYTPQGNLSFSMLIFQDIVIVPMMLVLPFLAGEKSAASFSIIVLALKAGSFFLFMFLSYKYLAPIILSSVVKTRNRELFLLTTLALCFSIALFTSKIGLSLSLGAFLAGLIMAESEYSLSAIEGILPFRDVFTSLFFVSVGMLLDIKFFISHILTVMIVALGIIMIKITTAFFASLALRFPVRPAIIVGFSLCQIGEFSFILAKSGMNFGLMSETDYQLFLAASIVTMALTPLFIAIAPKAADASLAFSIFRKLQAISREPEIDENVCTMETCDHLVIAGFGLGGKNVAHAAKAAGIAYNIIEMNPDSVKSAKRKGEPVSYGDATHAAVLENAGIRRARVFAVIISDPAATRRVVSLARKMNPAVHIIVRTRFLKDLDHLMKLGADDVISEEFETSVEMFTRVLSKYLVPRFEIERFTSEIREKGYEMLRSFELKHDVAHALSAHFTDMDLVGFRIEKEAFLDGKTLETSELRKSHGLTVIAVKRDGQIISSPDGTFLMESGDIVYLFGERSGLSEKEGLFS